MQAGFRVVVLFVAAWMFAYYAGAFLCGGAPAAMYCNYTVGPETTPWVNFTQNINGTTQAQDAGLYDLGGLGGVWTIGLDVVQNLGTAGMGFIYFIAAVLNAPYMVFRMILGPISDAYPINLFFIIINTFYQLALGALILSLFTGRSAS